MSENIYSQRKMRNESLKKNDFLEFLKKEAVLIIALLLAVINCFSVYNIFSSHGSYQ